MATEKLPLLLATKVLPPRLPAGLIDRPRLLDLVGLAQTRRLIVIKAPAGFGKTSLALTWLARWRASGARIAWLSLDADDDEPARFLYHLAQALRHACSSVGASALGLMVETSLVPAQAVVSTLINELAEIEDDVYLFLDDYHLINLPAIHDAMSFLLTHARRISMWSSARARTPPCRSPDSERKTSCWKSTRQHCGLTSTKRSVFSNMNARAS